MVNRQFLVIFLLVTIAFSFFAYQPIDVVIAGPQMTDLEKFEIELKSIEDSTGIKIKYETYSDIDELYTEIPNNIIPYLASDIFLTPIVKAEHGSSSGVRGAAHLW